MKASGTNQIPLAIMLGSLLAFSLMTNVVQFFQARQDNPYAQMGRNLIRAEKAAQSKKIGSGMDCETMGALQSTQEGVLTCSAERKWTPAKCNQLSLLSKDDFGVILVCDGALFHRQ